MTLRQAALAGFTAAAAFVSVIATGGEIPAGDRRSGYEFMSPELRAMQDDGPRPKGNRIIRNIGKTAVHEA